MDYKSSNIRLWSRLGSCGALGQAALELGETNDKVVFITSDLCFYSGLDRFNAKFPDKLYNVGIAEQNMVNIAAGMAKEGFIPFATTYATFAAMRCADQVRVSMGYMKLGVKLIGLTAGLSVGILGATHMSIEDIAIMRSIPNIIILSPADCTESIKAILAASETDEPIYIRLTGGMPNPIVYKEDYDYKIGKAITLKDGSDIIIYATGTMVYNSLKAAEILAEQGISAKVVDIHTIKPIDRETINDNLNYKMIFTVEEHSTIGGLGSAVAECLSEADVKINMIGLHDQYDHAADYNYLIEKNGLDATGIAKRIIRKYKELD